MNNPSPTTMKECSCPHPHDYCDFKETICQPSEEAEKCKCHCHRGHLKDHGFNYDNCAGEYCGHCTNLSQLSEEKYTGIVRDSEGNIVEIIDNIVGVKPNSTALEWEKDLSNLLTKMSEHYLIDDEFEKQLKWFTSKLLTTQRGEIERSSQIDLLQRQRGIMGKYNCNEDCEFDKKYFDLAQKELDKLSRRV